MDVFDELAQELHHLELSGALEEDKAALLRSRIGPLLKALEAVEWVWDTNDGEPACAWCGKGEGKGHARNCQRQAALAAWQNSFTENAGSELSR